MLPTDSLPVHPIQPLFCFISLPFTDKSEPSRLKVSRRGGVVQEWPELIHWLVIKVLLHCHEQIRCNTYARAIRIARIIVEFPSVMIDFGFFWQFAFKNVWSSHTYVASVSLDTMAQPNTMVQWWLFTPTKGTKGIPYLVILYVLSNIVTYPYNW